MRDKFIHRKRGGEAEEGLSHFTEEDPKLDSNDPMEVAARDIVFGKEIDDASKEIVIKEKLENFKDEMHNTDQYLKFINAHIAANMSKVEKIKEAERRFKEEIECLQNNTVKPRAELDKVNYKDATENDARSLLTHLETERNILREKLAHQEQQIEKTRQQLQQKDEQLASIKNDLQVISEKNAPPNDDPVAVIREELARLGIKDDSAKIFDAVNALSRQLNSKK